MKSAEWKRVVQPLVPAGERWGFRGSLCYRMPVGRFLFGLLGEGSGFDRGVYIWRVSMPLFVPSEVIVLNYSERIGGGSKKYDLADIDELSSAIKSGFRELPVEDSELRRLVALAVDSPNRTLSEAAAYSDVLLGDRAGALDAIKRATRGEIRHDWEREVVHRLTEYGQILLEEGEDAAVRQLDSQAKRTAAVLGVGQE